MAKETEAPTAWTPNQVVAYRVATARRLRGWTQEQAATALAPYLGTKLSPASFSAIERSYLGGRIRRFNADEILALSRGFDLPIGWFFTPPPIGDGIHIATPDSPPDGYDPTVMVNAILGLAENLPHWDEALRKWWDGPSELSSPLDPAGHFVHFRAQFRVGELFGDTGAARAVLERMLGLLDTIEATPPADADPPAPDDMEGQ